MPRSFVDITFSANGTSAVAVARRLQNLDRISFISGEHDLSFDWQSPVDFEALLSVIHEALTGTGATYRVHTLAENGGWSPPPVWPPSLAEVPAVAPEFSRRRKTRAPPANGSSAPISP